MRRISMEIQWEKVEGLHETPPRTPSNPLLGLHTNCGIPSIPGTSWDGTLRDYSFLAGGGAQTGEIRGEISTCLGDMPCLGYA